MINQALTEMIAERLGAISGVRAVVLGGSRARGIDTISSDYDLGLYYSPEAPFDLEPLQNVISELDDLHRPNLLTPIGEWGPWINGGGWTKIRGEPVDFLYRDLTKVAEWIDRSAKGTISIDYQPGHPFGFCSYIYYGEVATCRLLYERDDQFASLKATAALYPLQLKTKILEKFGWEIRFCVTIASKSAARRDYPYLAGCVFRSLTCLAQVLFSVNEQFWLNEKNSIAVAARFPVTIPNLMELTDDIFASLYPDPEGALAKLNQLCDQAESLLFQLKT